MRINTPIKNTIAYCWIRPLCKTADVVAERLRTPGQEVEETVNHVAVKTRR